MPASYYGSELACWTGEGCDNMAGRRCCEKVDARFQTFQGDLHNMVPAVGVINGARLNYPYGEIPGEEQLFGTCDIEVDRADRLVEPPPHVRGNIARIWPFMREVYGVPDPNPEYGAMLMRWHENDPVDEWEQERNRRIAGIQGRLNHWISPERQTDARR